MIEAAEAAVTIYGRRKAVRFGSWRRAGLIALPLGQTVLRKGDSVHEAWDVFRVVGFNGDGRAVLRTARPRRRQRPPSDRLTGPSL